MNKEWKIGIVVGLMALAGFGVTRPAHALPPNEIETVWYSDPGRTHEVGRKITLGCYGGYFEMEGTTGPYNRKFYTPCS